MAWMPKSHLALAMLARPPPVSRKINLILTTISSRLLGAVSASFFKRTPYEIVKEQKNFIF